MFRARFMASLLVVGLVANGFLMGEDKKGEQEPVVINTRLPTYYSKLGLSAKQKNDILKVRAKCAVETEKLKRQIAALKVQETMDMENLLTKAQKDRLIEIRSKKK